MNFPTEEDCTETSNGIPYEIYYHIFAQQKTTQ